MSQIERNILWMAINALVGVIEVTHGLFGGNFVIAGGYLIWTIYLIGKRANG